MACSCSILLMTQLSAEEISHFTPKKYQNDMMDLKANPSVQLNEI